MKTFIKSNPLNTITGYDLCIEHDDGRIEVKPIEKTGLEKKTGINWLILPENPSNRKLINPARLKDKESLELTYKESVKIGQKSTTPKAPTKGIEEYLDGDDKELYLSLVKKAMRNREKMMLKAQIEQLERELQEMGE